MDDSTAPGQTEDSNELYLVVRNHEEQYSIWRDSRPVPDGWEVVGVPAPKARCLERIGQLWTDMRPASLRRRMASDLSP